jgi:gas vesicle protein
MTISLSKDKQLYSWDKSSLKSKYKALQSGTEDKFEAWLMTIEEHWTDEIAACLQGKFPDWRG